MESFIFENLNLRKFPVWYGIISSTILCIIAIHTYWQDICIGHKDTDTSTLNADLINFVF